MRIFMEQLELPDLCDQLISEIRHAWSANYDDQWFSARVCDELKRLCDGDGSPRYRRRDYYAKDKDAPATQAYL